MYKKNITNIYRQVYAILAPCTNRGEDYGKGAHK